MTAKDRVKQRLKSYDGIVQEIRQIEGLLAALEDRMLPGGKAMDGMPRSPGGGGDLSDIVAEKLDLQDKYIAKKAELNREQLEIENMIDGLNSLERQLIRAKYIEGHTWEEVCVIISYCWAQTHRIHAGILDKLAKKEEQREGTI